MTTNTMTTNSMTIDTMAPWRCPLRVMGLIALLAVQGFSISCALARNITSYSYAVYAGWRPSGVERQSAPYGIEAVCARATLNYIVPVNGGVVLIDAGYEESGAVLKAAIGERTLLAILLTHAHIDHRLAAHQFDVPVYVGVEDAPWLESNDVDMAPTLKIGRLLLGLPPRPGRIEPVAHGEHVSIGNAVFHAVHLPGHTPGSVAWRYRDVLFTGDAVQAPSGDAVYPAPDAVTFDMDLAWKSMARLSEVPFTLAFDGHNGRIDNAKSKVLSAVENGETHGYPTVPTDTPRGCKEPD